MENYDKGAMQEKEETTNQEVRRAVKSAFAEAARRTIAQWIVMEKIWFCTSAWMHAFPFI